MDLNVEEHIAYTSSGGNSAMPNSENFGGDCVDRFSSLGAQRHSEVTMGSKNQPLTRN
jgi:hypothetical protein